MSSPRTTSRFEARICTHGRLASISTYEMSEVDYSAINIAALDDAVLKNFKEEKGKSENISERQRHLQLGEDFAPSKCTIHVLQKGQKGFRR